MTNSNHKQDKGTAIEEPLHQKHITILGWRLLPIVFLFALVVLLMKLLLGNI